MRVENVTLLKEEVEKIFGRKILTVSDCLCLSKDIQEQTQFSLSLNTLRRFFHLMKSKYQPSIFTLNLLAKYCGFESLSDFLTCKESGVNHIPNHDTGLLSVLVLLFKDTDVSCTNDITYTNLIQKVITNLPQWQNVVDLFQQQIARTVNGQSFYYEQFVNIDKLNGFYGEGLRYYLHEKKTPAAQVFGHSLLCFRSWLSADKEGVKRHYNEVLRYTIDETAHPFASGRFFAAQLYHAHMHGDAIEPIITRSRVFYTTLRSSRLFCQSFPLFEYIVAEALVLIHQYEEALFYINEALKRRNTPITSQVNVNLFESIYLFQAIALAHIGKVEKSKDILESISTKNFYFLSKYFNSVLYLTLKQYFKKREPYQKQLQYLVQLTGFKQLVMNKEEEAPVAAL